MRKINWFKVISMLICMAIITAAIIVFVVLSPISNSVILSLIITVLIVGYYELCMCILFGNGNIAKKIQGWMLDK